MRVFKKIFLAFLALCLIGYIYIYTNYVIPILTYHSISQEYSGTPTVSPKNFETQMKYLKERKYNVISLNELVSGIISKKKFSRNTVVVTFDDGLKDNYLNAYSILKKYDIPATIFLISDCINKKPEYLNWNEVREMLSNRINFGAHTMRHAYLPELNRDKKWQEIKGAKEQIEANIGQTILYFCYPSGGFNEEIKNLIKKAGFKAACTTNRGYDKSNRDIFELKRIKVTNKDGKDLIKFHIKLSGYYNIFRSKKNPY